MSAFVYEFVCEIMCLNNRACVSLSIPSDCVCAFPQRLNMPYMLNQCAAIFGIPNMMPTTIAINKYACMLSTSAS